jgi:hypothetical protein
MFKLKQKKKKRKYLQHMKIEDQTQNPVDQGKF